MSRQTGVFARQDTTLVSDELAEQGGVFEVERVDGEVNLRLGARSARLHGAAATFFFIRMSFTWHSLLNFAMKGVAAEEGIVLLQFHFFRLQFFVPSGHVARRGLALFPCFGALDCYDLAWHKIR